MPMSDADKTETFTCHGRAPDNLALPHLPSSCITYVAQRSSVWHTASLWQHGEPHNLRTHDQRAYRINIEGGVQRRHISVFVNHGAADLM